MLKTSINLKKNYVPKTITFKIPNIPVKNISHNYLDEGLDFGAFVQFSFAHPLVHLPRVPINTSHQGMSVLFVGGAIVVILDNYGLPARVPATKDQHDFTLFHNLPHREAAKKTTSATHFQ